MRSRIRRVTALLLLQASQHVLLLLYDLPGLLSQLLLALLLLQLLPLQLQLLLLLELEMLVALSLLQRLPLLLSDDVVP